ncbi:MAG: metalloregulator ArsR/SmtB family transcription factor [Candidatus Krumholzibacteriota bacterium]|nr:metalloregulator ArsR/SmtB family transcription factor [Candidatus Krumholzibacteriota bacterium]
MPSPQRAAPDGVPDLTDSLDFFKALANPQRLKILGLLASRPAVVEEITAALALSPATVSHHLRVLRQAGLVSARSDQQYRLYELEERRLRQMSRELLRLENLRLGAGPFPEGAFERKVLDAFLRRGRLVGIPAQRKKREVVLRWLAGHFETERRYKEAEVNRVIGRYHEDYCTLRRELIMAKLLARDGGVYWRKS